MSGSTARAGFGISITATDSGATAVIEKVNKGIQSLTASGDKAGKALLKFGEVSGISRLTEGMSSLGRSATDTFRAIDQTGSSLASLIAPLTIAGVAALTRNWGAFGQGMVNMAHRLQLPVEALSKLQNAARLAGVPAEAMTNALSTLQEKLYGAAWNTDPAAVHILRDVLHIDPGTPGHVKNVAVALDEVAAALQKVGDPHTKQLILDSLGIDRAMLPYLENYKRFQKDADATGANITADQAKHASALKQSWDRLSLDLEGIYNRILDSWSGTVTQAVAASSKWIESNKDTADSIAKISTAIASLIAMKPAAWILRLLGLGSLATPAVAVPAAAAVVLGSTFLKDQALKEQMDQAAKTHGFEKRGGSLWNPLNKMPTYYNAETKETLTFPEMQKRLGADPITGQLPDAELKRIADTLERMEGEGGMGGGRRGGAGAAGGGVGTAPLTVPSAPSAAAGNMRTIHDFFKGKGLSEKAIAGILVNASAESGFDPTKSGDDGTSYGVFQHHGTRLDAMRRWAGTQTPSLQQQLEYSWMELQTSKASTWAAMQSATEPGQAGAIWSSGFEIPAGGPGEAFRRGQAAPAFEAPFAAPPRAAPALPAPPGAPAGGQQHSQVQPAPEVNGHVRVDVALSGAPPGTRASVQTSGHARAAPPRIETALPYAA